MIYIECDRCEAQIHPDSKYVSFETPDAIQNATDDKGWVKTQYRTVNVHSLCSSSMSMQDFLHMIGVQHTQHNRHLASDPISKFPPTKHSSELHSG